MGLSAHDQTFALRVDLKEITELSGVKKQAGAELYPKLSKKFKKVRKKCEKHQIFRKLAADSSADASADEVGRINIRNSWHSPCSSPSAQGQDWLDNFSLELIYRNETNKL